MGTFQLLMPGLTKVDRKKPVRVVGIDLGTANSTIAEVRWEPGGAAPKVRCVEVEQPTLEGTYTHVLIPSVVAIHEGRVWAGKGAKRLRGLGRSRTLFWDEARGFVEDVEDRLGDEHAIAAGSTNLR